MAHVPLAELFTQLADNELSERVASGGLTDEARMLAVAELLARGLDVPEVAEVNGPVPEVYFGDMVQLERNMSPTEAHLLCACLRSAGIQADAGDTHIVQAHSLLAIAVGGASVRVPRTQLVDAQEVVAAFRSGALDLGDDFDPGSTPAA